MNLELLRKKDFILLMFGKLVSLIGTKVQSVALSIYVLSMTGSATKFASVLAITFIPSLILGPIAGVFVDWFDRKKIIVMLDFISGAIITIFIGIFLSKGSFNMTEIYMLVISLSMASLIFQPAISTVIPSMIKKEKLMEANSINSVVMNIGNFLGPAIAGIILGKYGMLIVLVLNAISFILSGISEMFINIPKTNKKPEKISIRAFKDDFKVGLVYVKNKKIILNIILLGVFINFFFQPMASMGRLFVAKEVLKVSDDAYGLMESILVTAMFIAPVISTWISDKIQLGKILVIGMISTSILGGALALVSTKMFRNNIGAGATAYIALIIIGFMIVLATSVGNISLYTMFQKEIDLDVMGRVNTVMNTGLMAITPVGQMFFGYSFDRFETWKVILLGAVAIFIIIMLFRKRIYVKDSKMGEKLST